MAEIKDLVMPVLQLQEALESNGVDCCGMEITLSAKAFETFKWKLRSTRNWGYWEPGNAPIDYTVVGVPFKAKPLTLKERTDAVCAKIAGGYLRPVKSANG